MSIASLGNATKKTATHHPILSRCVGAFLAIALVLGLMHEAEIGGEVSIVMVKRFKRQAEALVDVGQRLKHELTTWDTDSEHAVSVEKKAGPRRKR